MTVDASPMLTLADLRADGPTEVAISRLNAWVLWQFPRPRRGGLCAALHPPEARFGWLPAIVHPGEERVEVFAHAAGPFSTPEEAAGWMERA